MSSEPTPTAEGSFSVLELIDLALGGGVVNFNILRILLRDIVEKTGVDKELAKVGDLEAGQMENYKNFVQGSDGVTPKGVLKLDLSEKLEGLKKDMDNLKRGWKRDRDNIEKVLGVELDNIPSFKKPEQKPRNGPGPSGDRASPRRKRGDTAEAPSEQVEQVTQTFVKANEAQKTDRSRSAGPAREKHLHKGKSQSLSRDQEGGGGDAVAKPVEIVEVIEVSYEDAKDIPLEDLEKLTQAQGKAEAVKQVVQPVPESEPSQDYYEDNYEDDNYNEEVAAIMTTEQATIPEEATNMATDLEQTDNQEQFQHLQGLPTLQPFQPLPIGAVGAPEFVPGSSRHPPQEQQQNNFNPSIPAAPQTYQTFQFPFAGGGTPIYFQGCPQPPPQVPFGNMTPDPNAQYVKVFVPPALNGEGPSLIPYILPLPLPQNVDRQNQNQNHF